MGCFYIIRTQISDLNGDAILKGLSISQLKKMTEILVIDDDSFPFTNALRKNEFSIEYKTDIFSLKDVAEYDIILCDIKGVGKFLESTYEGAYLVKQIKEKYPNKIVISYTANDYNPRFQEYLDYADATVPKGTTLEDWDALLSKKLYEIADPVIQWEKTRTALLKAGVSTINVAKYEAMYVKAMENGKYETLQKLISDKQTHESEIIQSLLWVLEKFAKAKGL